MQSIKTTPIDLTIASSCCGSHAIPALGAAAWRCKECELLCTVDPNISRKEDDMFQSLHDEDYSEQNAQAPYEGENDSTHLDIDSHMDYELTDEDVECVSY